MPGGDRTGPLGAGQGTGRGRGFCAGRRAQLGLRCWGYGKFYGRPQFGQYGSQVALTKDEEKKILEAELKEIEAEKQAIGKRLKELK